MGELDIPCGCVKGSSGVRHTSLPSIVQAIRPNPENSAYTLRPSVTGVDDAGSFGSDFRSTRVTSMVCSHNRSPLFRSTHLNSRRLATCPAKNTRSPTTIGEELPAGASLFQTRFFDGPNSTGKSLASETPDPFGPRNRGQSAD